MNANVKGYDQWRGIITELNKKTMNKDETILEIMKDYPTQKIGLDDFYGTQTVINMMNKAINYTPCCMGEAEQLFALLRYTMPDQFTDVALKNVIKGFIEQSK